MPDATGFVEVGADQVCDHAESGEADLEAEERAAPRGAHGRHVSMKASIVSAESVSGS